MANLKFQYQPAPGLQKVVSAENSGLKYISLSVLHLKKGEIYHANSSGEELALVLITGSATVKAAGHGWENIGGRKNVFERPAHVVYIPCNTDYDITALTELEVAIGGSVSDKKSAPALITPDMSHYERRGVWSWERHIYDLITAHNPVSQRLYIIEVITPPGHWSSVPPHKHDEENPPYESSNEEIYFYKFKPEQGFGFQRIYTGDGSLDEVCLAVHNSAIIQPKGYHPVANHPGYQMYYLNIIAGDKRHLLPSDDPQHAWVKDVEQVIKYRQ